MIKYQSKAHRSIAPACVAVLLVTGFGCAGRPALFPNSDHALRHTSSEFAADAAVRHPYKSDAPRGEQAKGRAEIEYGIGELRLLNLSDDEWTDIEVWVNQTYVVHIPKMAPGKLETIKFPMLYNDKGHFFTSSVAEHHPIKKVELLMDGKMHDLRVALAE